MKLAKNLIFSLLFVLFISSCEQPEYIRGTSKKEYGNDIHYFMDARTGLCFAERGTGSSYTFTCVPCDSLKKKGIFFY